MNAEEVRDMTSAQLLQELEESRKELFNIRRDLALRKFKNHQRLPAVKKDIARIMTVLRERELMAQYGGVDVEELVGVGGPTRTEEVPRRKNTGLLGRLRRGNR